MSDSTESYAPAAHYDRVTRAWSLLLGPELHFGVFDSPDESLDAATARLTQLMIANADLSANLRLLDVGCGSGTQAVRLSREFDLDVLGITTSAVGIEESTARAQAAGATRATFELRDGMANGLPDASFDRVWALESSHLMADRAAVVSEAARVLKPGGRFVLCDLMRRRDIPFAELRARRDEFATLRAAFGAARMDPMETYVAHAEAAGLEVDAVIDITAETFPTFARWRENLERHRDAVVDALGTEGATSFGRSLEVLEGLWQDGTMGYGLFSAALPQSDAS